MHGNTSHCQLDIWYLFHFQYTFVQFWLSLVTWSILTEPCMDCDVWHLQRPMWGTQHALSVYGDVSGRKPVTTSITTLKLDSVNWVYHHRAPLNVTKPGVTMKIFVHTLDVTKLIEIAFLLWSKLSISWKYSEPSYRQRRNIGYGQQIFMLKSIRLEGVFPKFCNIRNFMVSHF